MNEQLHVVEHRIGTDGSISFTCRDASGNPVDLSASTVAVQISDYPGADAVAPTTAVPIAGTITKTAAGVVTVPIADTELTTLTPGSYALAVSATLSGVRTIYPIHGALVLKLLPKTA